MLMQVGKIVITFSCIVFLMIIFVKNKQKMDEVLEETKENFKKENEKNENEKIEAFKEKFISDLINEVKKEDLKEKIRMGLSKNVSREEIIEKFKGEINNFESIAVEIIGDVNEII